MNITKFLGGMQSVSKSRKSKTKIYDTTISVNFPSIRGVLSANQIGSMFAMELIDLIRDNWKHGKDVMGNPVRKTIHAAKNRYAHRAILRNVSLQDDLSPRKRQTGETTKQARKRNATNRYRKRVLKNYTLTKRFTDRLNGVRTQKTTMKTKFIPEPLNPAINSSGLMIAGLAGGYTTMRIGKNGSTQSVIRIRVPASRNLPAFLYGGLRPENSAATLRFIYSHASKFPYTNALLNSLLSVDPNTYNGNTTRNSKLNYAVNAINRYIRFVLK